MKQVPDFLVCGEALMDVFPAEDTPRGVTLDARVGGSPFNVAVGLARMSQSVALLAGVSRDTLGERLMRELEYEGVATSCVVRTAAPTTLSVIDVDTRRSPTYAFHGEGGADRQVTVAALDRLPLDLSAVHVGSYAMVVEPIAHTLRTLVDRVRGRALIAWDPNVRATIVPDLTRWRELLRWMLPRTDVLKVSEEDLEALVPGANPDAFAADAITAGVGLVVVTRGANGSVARTRNAQAQVAADPVVVLDSVGAGDTFQSALLTWLREHDALSGRGAGALPADELTKLLRFASRSAAITCGRRGADLPNRADLGEGWLPGSSG